MSLDSPTSSTEEVCAECGLAVLDDVDPEDVCGDCRTADLVWSETHHAGETRVTRVSINERSDGGECVVVDQRWHTETDLDRVGLPAARLDTIRDMILDTDSERHEFEDQFGDRDDPVDGVTTIEADEAAVVSQKLDPERIADVVTLTLSMVSSIRVELNGGDSA